MFEKIRYSVLYWICLRLLTCFCGLWLLDYAYIGPPEEFWVHFGDVPQIIFSGGLVVSVFTELLLRMGRKPKEEKGENNER